MLCTTCEIDVSTPNAICEKCNQPINDSNGHNEFELALKFLSGRGKKKDLSKAVAFLSQSAQAGNVYAQYMLGSMYEEAHGVEMDIERAVNWYEKAAKQGSSQALYALERHGRSLKTLTNDGGLIVAVPQNAGYIDSQSAAIENPPSSETALPLQANINLTAAKPKRKITSIALGGVVVLGVGIFFGMKFSGASNSTEPSYYAGQGRDPVYIYAAQVATRLRQHPACQVVAQAIMNVGVSTAPDYVREKQIDRLIDKAPNFCFPG